MHRAPDDPRFLRIQLRRELLASGYNDKALAKALRDKILARPRRGAYVDASAWSELDASSQYAVRARAVVLQANTAVVLSHRSALPFYGAPTYGIDLSEVDVTRLDRRAGRREAGVRQHKGRIVQGDVVSLGGLRLTSATRTALEMTTLAEPESALAVVNHLLFERLTTLERLEERYAQSMEPWPQSLRTELVLRLADARIESVGESRCLFLFWQQGLPKPEPQFEVFDRVGTLVARLDFAWPRHGLWAEFDGRTKYEGLRRPGESAVDVLMREKKREELVRRLTGWRCIRITWDELSHPVRLATDIRALLSATA